jgi:hypothetical protein
MSDEPRKGSRIARTLWAALIVVFVLYPLASGPSIWLVRSTSEMEVYCAVFAPLQWLRHRSDAFNTAFSWYTEIWDPPEGYQD